MSITAASGVGGGAGSGKGQGVRSASGVGGQPPQSRIHALGNSKGLNGEPGGLPAIPSFASGGPAMPRVAQGHESDDEDKKSVASHLTCGDCEEGDDNLPIKFPTTAIVCRLCGTNSNADPVVPNFPQKYGGKEPWRFYRKVKNTDGTFSRSHKGKDCLLCDSVFRFIGYDQKYGTPAGYKSTVGNDAEKHAPFIDAQKEFRGAIERNPALAEAVGNPKKMQGLDIKT